MRSPKRLQADVGDPAERRGTDEKSHSIRGVRGVPWIDLVDLPVVDG
jgi:hypothetical protein